jgi:hypothetical protein
MPLRDNLMHEPNRGIRSILKTLDTGTVVSIGIYCLVYYNAKFINYDPEANLAFFSLQGRPDPDPFFFIPPTSLAVEADRIEYIEKFETIVPNRI